MRTEAPALIPIFRSSLQARLLLRVLTDGAGHTTTDLARLLDAPVPTVHREVRRLMEADLLTGTRVGRSVVLRPADHNPATGPLRQLLVVTYGPAAYLERALTDVVGIEEAYVYGSWAARWHGEAGDAPGDVDLLVVGTPDRSAVYDALDGIDSALGREVNVTFVSPERWASGDEPFLATLRQRPLVRLGVGEHKGEAA
ncbi:helix-turn-helix domain-containing protein [Cellulomonas sp. KRMCY2]|uniref:helix-turn-helix domain-containing protein n=1 Tax=Cellulomonas sp. KRMCY2 TaxID=1304865 RepID=UPI00045E6562|nr:helix-turn-helix domain-containing protein [Cellulomonas sp. KRMCY2]